MAEDSHGITDPSTAAGLVCPLCLAAPGSPCRSRVTGKPTGSTHNLRSLALTRPWLRLPAEAAEIDDEPPYDRGTMEQLDQIVESPTWDGNLISKSARDTLARDACVLKDLDARDPRGPRDTGAWVSTKKGRLISFIYAEDEGDDREEARPSTAAERTPEQQSSLEEFVRGGTGNALEAIELSLGMLIKDSTDEVRIHALRDALALVAEIQAVPLGFIPPAGQVDISGIP